MVENFGNAFYLIIFIINLLGLIYYAYLTYLNPKQLINDYETGDDSIVFIRVIGIAALPLEQLPAEAVALALSIGQSISILLKVVVEAEEKSVLAEV